MTTFLVSDTHFSHLGVCQFLREDGTKLRPFTTPEEMDEELVKRWNETVSKNDKVYHLGDVSIGKKGLKVLERLNGDKVLVRGNHDCLDEETEALTQRGWKKYTDLNKSDFVLSLNPETLCSEWMSIDKIIIKEADVLYSHKGRGIDMLVTENHRVATLKKGKLAYFQPNRMQSTYKIPVSSKRNNISSISLSNDELTLLAWVYTDGCLNRNKGIPFYFMIYQSKQQNVIKIRELLKRLNLSFAENIRNRDRKVILGKSLKSSKAAHEFRIHADSAKKYLPYLGDKKILNKELLLGLDDRQAVHFLRGLMDGDGSWASNKFFQSGALHGKKEFLDSVQILALQHGIRAYITVAREHDFRLNLFFDSMVRTFNSTVKRFGFKKNVGRRKVWCISTPHTNFMVRRNGAAYFTGNCEKLSAYTKYFRDVRGCHVLDKMILTHVPVHPESKGRFLANAHGHTHARRVMIEIADHEIDEKNPITGQRCCYHPVQKNKIIDPFYFSVCVEHTDYRPIAWEEVKRRIAEQK